MFVALGLGITALLFGVLSRWRGWVKLLWSILVLLVTGAAIIIVLGPAVFSSTVLRSGGVWWNVSPWKEALLLLAMLAGMFLRVSWDAIETRKRRRSRTEPVFDRWNFVSPAIIALVVFQPVLSMGEGQPMSVKLALFSLQNGFFWNTLFEKIKETARR